jgi:hypothetical protein
MPESVAETVIHRLADEGYVAPKKTAKKLRAPVVSAPVLIGTIDQKCLQAYETYKEALEEETVMTWAANARYERKTILNGVDAWMIKADLSEQVEEKGKGRSSTEYHQL